MTLVGTASIGALRRGVAGGFTCALRRDKVSCDLGPLHVTGVTEDRQSQPAPRLT
jgi:hypothetical protein